MMRQICKRILTTLLVPAIIVWGAAGFWPDSEANAATTSTVTTIVTDPLSGIAIAGYDPVSYFTETEPLSGRPEFEFIWGGVPWYFASAANRDVFMRSPEIYAPMFGGYGVMGLARGYLSEGNPRIYAVLQNRLFLFYSTGNRDAFLLSQRQAYQLAVKNWEFLSLELAKDQGPMTPDSILPEHPLDIPEGAPQDTTAADGMAPAEGDAATQSDGHGAPDAGQPAAGDGHGAAPMEAAPAAGDGHGAAPAESSHGAAPAHEAAPSGH
jgi:hypothetical protein